MKFLCLFFFLSVQVSAMTYSQDARLTLTLHDISLTDVFSTIRRSSEYSFIYNMDDVRNIRVKSLEVKDASIREILDLCLKNTGFVYQIEDHVIVIQPREEEDKRGKLVYARGAVVDGKKEPMPGVTVVLKGTTRGVTTNVDGRFVLLIPDSTKAELVFSFVGMKTVTLKYQDRPKKGVWFITMEEESVAVDEVTVVSTGYGDVDRRRLTSAVTSLKMDDIMTPGLNTIDQMLEGRIPGMIFMRNSGQVGASPRVRIRGTSTVLGNQDPLWVIDGIVQHDPVNVDPSKLNDLDFVNLLGNAVSGLNPDDIERIDVLKDAAATAIYGTRAANGVIVITTKKGKAGPPTISYSLNGTINRRPRYSDREVYVMNSKERVDVSRELFERQMGFANVTVWNGYEKAMLDYKAGLLSFNEYKKKVDYFETINTDWFDLLCKDSFSNKHTLSMSGGSQNMNYYVSVGYNDQQGVIRGEENKQLTSSLKLNGYFNRLQFQFNVQFSNSKSAYTPSVDGENIVSYAYRTSRSLPAYNPDGTRYFYQKGNLSIDDYFFNMENEMETTRQRMKSHSVTMTGNVKYRLFDNLNIEGTASYTTGGTNQETVYEEDSYYVTVLRQRGPGDFMSECPLGGEWNNMSTLQSSWLGRLQLNYSRNFGEENKHFVHSSLGGEISSKEYSTLTEIQRGYYPDRGKVFAVISEDLLKSGKYDYYLKWLANNKPVVSETLTNLGSAYFTATYSYDNRYTLNFNTRMDISNQFGSNSRDKLLPIWSVSGRWDIGQEFWEDNSNVNELALKLSYGHQGNMIDNQTSRMVIAKDLYNDYHKQFAASVKFFPNPDLQWEMTSSYNAELTFSLLKNKITGSFGYYYKKTRDAFLTKNVSVINGVPTYVVNKGELSNQGVEVALSFTPINQQVGKNGKRGFVWRFDPQIGQVVNKLVNKAINDRNNVLRDEVTFQDFLNGNVEIAGEPLETFYSYRFKGLSNVDGSPIFYGMEIEDKAKLHERYQQMDNMDVCLEVMTPSGTRVPVLQGSFSNYFGYRQFGLSFNFAYSLGNKIRMLKICEQYNINPYPGMNLRREFVNRWRKPGDEEKTNIPGLIASDRGVNALAWWNYGNENYKFADSNYYGLYDNSDIRVVSGDYLKLQSLSFRYNVHDVFCQRMGIKSAYLSLSGTNLFTLANKKLKGQDVTSQSGSASTINLSIRPTYSLTLNVTF